MPGGAAHAGANAFAGRGLLDRSTRASGEKKRAAQRQNYSRAGRRRAESAGIELTAGREAKGYKRLPAEQWAKIAETITKNPKATQEEVARATGVSRSTVGRIKRGARCGGPQAARQGVGRELNKPGVGNTR